MKSMLTALLITSLTIAPFNQYAVAQTASSPDVEEISFSDAMAAVETQIAKAHTARTHIDRNQIDLDELLTSLDFDAETIARFVREKVAFQQYEGLLRGALGTLLSRAGNSLDQSVLLATLLKDAGYEARISRATLSKPMADALMQRIQKSEVLPAADAEAMAALFASGTGPQAEADQHPQLARLGSGKDIDLAVSEILLALDKENITLGDDRMLSIYAEEARDYFWVEYRLGPSDSWTAQHGLVAQISCNWERALPETEFRRCVQSSGGQVQSSG